MAFRDTGNPEGVRSLLTGLKFPVSFLRRLRNGFEGFESEEIRMHFPFNWFVIQSVTIGFVLRVTGIATYYLPIDNNNNNNKSDNGKDEINNDYDHKIIMMIMMITSMRIMILKTVIMIKYYRILEFGSWKKTLELKWVNENSPKSRSMC